MKYISSLDEEKPLSVVITLLSSMDSSGTLNFIHYCSILLYPICLFISFFFFICTLVSTTSCVLFLSNLFGFSIISLSIQLAGITLTDYFFTKLKTKLLFFPRAYSN